MTPKERTFMKMIFAALILVAIIGGCLENDRYRIDILQTRVAGLQLQVDSLQEDSIQHSKSINNLSDGMTSAAESINNLRIIHLTKAVEVQDDCA